MAKDEAFLAGKRDARGRLLAGVNIMFHSDEARTQRDLREFGARELAAIEQSAKDTFAASGVTLLPGLRTRKVPMHGWDALVSDAKMKRPTGEIVESRSLELVDGPGSMTVTTTLVSTASPKLREASNVIVDSITAPGPRAAAPAVTNSESSAPSKSGAIDQ